MTNQKAFSSLKEKKRKKEIKKNKVPQGRNGFQNRVQNEEGALDGQLHMLVVHLLS